MKGITFHAVAEWGHHFSEFGHVLANGLAKAGANPAKVSLLLYIFLEFGQQSACELDDRLITADIDRFSAAFLPEG
jgi:hypothetical protein